jgi:hypothetical protein
VSGTVSLASGRRSMATPVRQSVRRVLLAAPALLLPVAIMSGFRDARIGLVLVAATLGWTQLVGI